jgi:hypothetical protein
VSYWPLTLCIQTDQDEKEVKLSIKTSKTGELQRHHGLTKSASLERCWFDAVSYMYNAYESYDSIPASNRDYVITVSPVEPDGSGSIESGSRRKRGQTSKIRLIETPGGKARGRHPQQYLLVREDGFYKVSGLRGAIASCRLISHRGVISQVPFSTDISNLNPLFDRTNTSSRVDEPVSAGGGRRRKQNQEDYDEEQEQERKARGPSPRDGKRSKAGHRQTPSPGSASSGSSSHGQSPLFDGGSGGGGGGGGLGPAWTEADIQEYYTMMAAAGFGAAAAGVPIGAGAVASFLAAPFASSCTSSTTADGNHTSSSSSILPKGGVVGADSTSLNSAAAAAAAAAHGGLNIGLSSLLSHQHSHSAHSIHPYPHPFLSRLFGNCSTDALFLSMPISAVPETSGETLPTTEPSSCLQSFATIALALSETSQ